MLGGLRRSLASSMTVSSEGPDRYNRFAIRLASCRTSVRVGDRS